MPDTLNCIRNADFALGAKAPRQWEWRARGDAAWNSAANAPHAGNGHAVGISLSANRTSAIGEWCQSFSIKKERHYRIEALVSCACPGPDGGVVLELRPLDAAGRELPHLASVPLRQAQRYTLRMFYKPDADVRRVELSVSLRGAGHASIHDVRVLPVLEPDARCHPWAVPPPPFANVAPIKAKLICLLTSNPQRPLIAMLRARFGDAAITARPSSTWGKEFDAADAVFLLDGPLPGRLKNLRGLKTFAKNRVVIASLPMMERISGKKLVTRLITQPDDPLHARVAYADFVTAGFALRDIFPFAAAADESAEQSQRQFRTNKLFREYCTEHGFNVLLDSETDQDSTSEKPIALLHRTPGGAIVVMDCEPAEAAGSSLDEPVLAARLVLNALGDSPPLVGQYISPARDAGEFLHQLRDTVERFGELSFADTSHTFDAHAPQMIMLGRDVETLGLPLAPRPLLLIRTGLTGADTAGVYAALLWLKHLLRPAPFTCPYANALDRAFRVGWIPMAAPLQSWGGWRPGEEASRFAMEIEFEPGSVAACIDLTTGPQHAVRVLTAGKNGAAARLRAALPSLTGDLLAGRHFYYAVASEDDPTDRRHARWRSDHLALDVRCDPAVFREEWQRSAQSAGAELIRIELPATPSADPTGHSIWLTDWAVTLLELIAGMLFGTIIVNREGQPLTVDVPAPLREMVSRGTLCPMSTAVPRKSSLVMRGQRLTLPPASALIAAG